ncbi:F6N18.16 [Arabidopsis thaliana]|nr:F6N18.16 [Arabidopsis thaliana]
MYVMHVAAVVWGPKVPLVIQEICVDPPQKMEVRVKILYSSICHTDLGCWNGTSVGEGVKDVKEGDYVIPTFNGECGECKVCKREESNLCERYHVDPMKRVMVNDGGTRFSTTINKDGGSSQSQPIYHFLNTSTFTEYTVLDSACVVKIDPNSPLKQMSLLSCGVSTGVGAAWNIANVKEGKSTAVFGLGSVGLAVAEGARARGASRIIGVDANASKFEKGTVPIYDYVHIITILLQSNIAGKLMGVTDFINPKDLTKPVHQGWGSTVLVGIYPTPRTLPLHPMELFDGRRITGSVFGGFKPKSQLPNFAQQCMKGVVKLEPFITNELPFEKINDAFQLLRDGKSLRCILQISKLLKR